MGVFRQIKNRIGHALPDRVRQGIAATAVYGLSIRAGQEGHTGVARRARQEAGKLIRGKGRIPPPSERNQIKSFKEWLEEGKLYSHSGKGFPRDEPYTHQTDDDYRGPHNGRELKMMLAGVKPAAFFPAGSEEIDKFEPHVQSGKIKALHRFDKKGNHTETIYHLPGEEERAKKIDNILSKSGTYSYSITHMARLGRLLGYPADNIKKFVDKAKQR
jgi:hypothetical protein